MEPQLAVALVAAVLAGLAAVITAVGTLVVAIRTGHKVTETKAEVREVHSLTNSRLTDMITKQTATDARVEQLLGILNRESLEVPVAPIAVVADGPVMVVPPSEHLTNEPTGPLVPDTH